MEIDNNNQIELKFLQNIQNMAAIRVLAFWAFVGVAPCWNKLALRRNPRICMLNSNVLAPIRKDGLTSRSTQLVNLIKNMYTLCGR